MDEKLFTFPSKEKIDEEILKIMDDNLEIIEGIIGNRFATSGQILSYFEKLAGIKFKYYEKEVAEKEKETN